MLKILSYLKKYWYKAILAPLFMIFEVLMDMLIVDRMEVMIDVTIPSGSITEILKVGLVMLLYVFVGVICGFLSGLFTFITGYNFANDLRKDTFRKIMDLSYNQTDEFKTGSLVTRVTNDVTQIQNFISMALRGFVRSIAFFALGIYFTLKISSKFGMILIILLPVELIILFVFAKFVVPFFSKLQKKTDRINTIVHENVTGARVVKAFSKEEYEIDRFKVANLDYSNTQLRVSVLMSLLIPLLSLLLSTGIVIIYYIGGESIFDHFKSALHVEMDIMNGEIAAAINYITMIVNAILMFGMIFTSLARAIASGKRILEIFDAKKDIVDGDFDINNKNKVGTVEFRNVSFAYPNSKEILHNINLNIKQGETIAIIGATGSGKSSLVNLISRFYDVTSGELLVDGVNVKDYKQYDLRSFISVSLQKSEMFAGTIEENILWGNPNASHDEVVKAAQISQSEEFILEKENGYNEYVEEKGTSLSGGQKQRLSIARALIKKPEILILDDSTSALDLLTEAKLYQEMKKEIGNVTKIVVAQRIATAKKADKIAVIDSGTIVAFDSHDKLIKSCEIYQDIYNSQLKKEGEE